MVCTMYNMVVLILGFKKNSSQRATGFQWHVYICVFLSAYICMFVCMQKERACVCVEYMVRSMELDPQWGKVLKPSDILLHNSTLVHSHGLVTIFKGQK